MSDYEYDEGNVRKTIEELGDVGRQTIKNQEIIFKKYTMPILEELKMRTVGSVVRGISTEKSSLEFRNMTLMGISYQLATNMTDDSYCLELIKLLKKHLADKKIKKCV